MALRLPAERSCWAALGLLALALGLLYFLGLHWWWTAPQLALRAELAELRDQELRLRMHAAQAPLIQEKLAEVQAFEAGNPGFLPEATVELATAGLVQRLETVVQQASPTRERCQLTGRTPSAARTQERYPRVVVQVRLRCGMEEFVAVLHALESGRPELFIDNLAVLSRRSLLAQGGAATSALDISFDLYGYLHARQTGGQR
ncbi:MAG: type II secretion system protein GspM [Rehaibacterium terrae]|jgi:general secretion pathway protein M|uniref:type II secretion system protein GspM n=1 Tax=Rehaibacterium terrae TaxID=1341696 RepID=UPI003918B216